LKLDQRSGAAQFPVQAVKSTGGGDGYASAFLFGLLKGKEVMECLEMGSASAAMLVRSHSCAPNMPSLSELEAFIATTKSAHGDLIARE
jgi:5-dehydro-2-deoxygluconokinase